MNITTLLTNACLVAATGLILTTTSYAATPEDANPSTAASTALTTGFVPPEITDLKSHIVTTAGRKSFNDNMYKESIEANLAQPLNAQNEDRWESAFGWVVYSMHRNETVLRSIRHSLDTHSERSDSFTRAALEAAYTLYPSELKAEVEKIACQTNNPKNFAMAVHYLIRLKPKRAKEFYDLSMIKFPDGQHDPLLTQLRLNLEKSFGERLKSIPPLVDLLGHRFPADAPVIFSFQRHNRDYPGLVVVRKQDGTFLRRPDGSLFAVSQLARAVSNGPAYLTNGNTPQGIFSIQHFKLLDFLTLIGPTPTIVLVMPNEKSVATYFHDQTRIDEKWKPELYRGLLPASWQDYVPIYEAYAAGEIGRCEIIAHGTTKDSSFHTNEPYYPNIPTHGCLCALEMWSQDGSCVYSDELALVKAYASLKSSTGYLVVVELDDQSRPVGMYDVLPSLLKAESHESR